MTLTFERSRFALLGLLWLLPPVCVAVHPSEPRTLERPLTQLSNQYLGLFVHVLPDTNGELTFSDVVRRMEKLPWVRGEHPIFNYGFNETPHWFHVAVSNDLAVTEEYLLEIGYPLLDHVDVYVLRRGEPPERVQLTQTGDSAPFADRPIMNPMFVFPVMFSPGDVTDIFVRIQTTSSLQVPISLWRPIDMLERNQSLLVIFGLFIGCVVVLILYNCSVILRRPRCHLSILFGWIDRLLIGDWCINRPDLPVPVAKRCLVA